MKFEELEKIDCSEKIEKRKSDNVELAYLSWAWAWSIFKKKCPDAQYSIKKFTNAKGEIVPYMYDENTGYMVNTEITVEGITYEMWLPVMNSNNKAMKNQPYTYKTKYNGEKTVDSASMFDINKTIMRCLVKNMAMFGLGLYIYAGEDLPDNEENKEKTKETKKEVAQSNNLTEEDADFDLLNGLAEIKDKPTLLKYYNDNYKSAKNQLKFGREYTKKLKEIEKGA